MMTILHLNEVLVLGFPEIGEIDKIESRRKSPCRGDGCRCIYLSDQYTIRFEKIRRSWKIELYREDDEDEDT